MNVKEYIRFGQHVMHSFMEETELPLKQKQIHLLTMVNFSPGKSFTFYAKRVGLEKGSFTYFVETLVKQGLLLKKSDQVDHRMKHLSLTQKGYDVVKHIQDLEAQYMDSFFAQFQKEDLEHLLKAEAVIKQYFKNKGEKQV